MVCNDWFGVITATVDSAWTSAAGSQSSNKNNATVVLNPTIYYELTAKNLGVLDSPEVKLHRDACTAAVTAAKSSDETQKILTTNLDCLYAAPPAYRHHLLFAVYPDVEYRYGTFDQSGATYTANQLVAGGGFELLYPARIGGAFAAWPYISAKYDVVKNYGASDLPIASTIHNHYADLDERAEFYVPGFRSLTGVDALVLIDIGESRPLGGGTGPQSWQFSRTAQLIVGDRKSGGLKPAITYRSGQDRGMTYDRQVILGVVYDVFGQGRQ
jgi:hypothetical protein